MVLQEVLESDGGHGASAWVREGPCPNATWAAGQCEDPRLAVEQLDPAGSPVLHG